MQIIEPIFCFIRESYFIKNSNFIKMLDCGDTKKQSRRTHLCIKIEKDGNNFCIPLRNNLGRDIRRYWLQQSRYLPMAEALSKGRYIRSDE